MSDVTRTNDEVVDTNEKQTVENVIPFTAFGEVNIDSIPDPVFGHGKFTTNTGDVVEFNYRKKPSTSSKFMFVKSVSHILTIDSEYDSVIRDQIFDYFLLSEFTDLDVPEIDSLSIIEALDVIDDILERDEEAIEIIKNGFGVRLLNSLNSSIDDEIEAIVGVRVHTNNLIREVSGFVSGLNSFVNDLDVGELLGLLTDISSKVGELK